MKFLLILIAMSMLISKYSIIEKEEVSSAGYEVFEESTDRPAYDADSLLDMFVNGEIMAYYDEEGEPFYITDLPNDPEDFTCYSVGDRVDLDNDGEMELIINGPYGGIYLDARDGMVYVLEEGGGTAMHLGYTQFDGATWLYHCDVTHAGREMYTFTCYDGRGTVVDSFDFNKEYWNTPNEPDGPDTVYTYRDEEITKEEYDELRMKMLGY